ncbi:MAG: leucine-rich repeat domain-containing protein [Oscillospiraceae bacterium]|nr:leucine-rich repeat domain-containing protein [Oscillospiraceae bacterium]
MNRKSRKKLTIAVVTVCVIAVIVAAVVIGADLIEKDRFNARYDLAASYWIDKEYDLAAAVLEDALKLKPDEKCYLLLSDVYRAKGDLDKATEVLTVASYSVPGKAITDKLAELKAEKERRTEKAEAILFAGIEYPPDTSALMIREAGLSDISGIIPLIKLTSVSLQDNEITDITPLRELKELTFLDLSNNKIKNLSPLSASDNLKTLYLDGNEITDFTPLYNLKSLTTLSVRDITMTKSQFDELRRALPGCGVYADKIQNEAKELRLGGIGFMSDVTDLNLIGLNISDLSVLSECTQIVNLDLRDNNITDLSPLINLSELERLCLRNNEIEDIRPLMSNVKITYLDLEGNMIKDVTPLEYLPGLSEAFFSSNPLSSVATFNKLPNLTRLGLKNTGLKDSDLDILKQLQSLRELAVDDNEALSAEKTDELKETLSGCVVTHSELVYTVTLGGRPIRSDATSVDAANSGITDISVLEKFTKLRSLFLAGNRISDISVLENMPDLEIVELRLPYGSNNGGIADISPLSGHRRLQILDLMNHGVSNLTPLTSCTSLVELYLNNTAVTDLSPLSTLNSLTTLELGYTAVYNLNPLSGLVNLRHLRLDGTDFSDITPLKSLLNLQTLSLYDTTLSAAKIDELRDALPNCRIETNMLSY